jgi:tripartite-type tricarboxylate transporter receptor subunit TctC
MRSSRTGLITHATGFAQRRHDDASDIRTAVARMIGFSGRTRAMWTRRMFLASLAIAVSSAMVGAAMAQSYPTRPVTIVVPFIAGGGTDLLARLTAQRLASRLGKPFLVENRPGGSTTLAAMVVVRAAPDGHTLMQATSSTMAINVTMSKHLPYEPLKDLIPVALLSANPFVLVVSADSPVKSVADLVALAKAKPNQLNYGSGGPGSMHHLSTELLLSLTGTRMTHVPYKATPPAVTDLIAGHIQVLFGDSTSTVPLIQQGKLRALAVTTTTRAAALPDIPTVAEAGVAGFESAAWQMIVAPAKTPPEIITLLNSEVRAIFSDAQVQKELSGRGLDPQVTGSPEQLNEFVRAEIARWRPIVQRAGVAASQ